MNRSLILDIIKLIRFMNCHFKINKERKKFLGAMYPNMEEGKKQNLNRNENDTKFDIESFFKEQIDKSLKLMADVKVMIKENIKILNCKTSIDGYMKNVIKNLLISAVILVVICFSCKIALSTAEILYYLLILAILGISIDNLNCVILIFVVAKSNNLLMQEHIGNLLFSQWCQIKKEEFDKKKE